jgi:hypothetical protein
MLSSRLRLSSGLLPSGFPVKTVRFFHPVVYLQCPVRFTTRYQTVNSPAVIVLCHRAVSDDADPSAGSQMLFRFGEWFFYITYSLGFEEIHFAVMMYNLVSFRSKCSI